MIYADTSIILQSLDETQAASKKAAEEALPSDTEKVVSELFLLELSATFSRRKDLISAVASEVTATDAAITSAYVAYVMSKHGLRLVESSGEKMLTPMGRVNGEIGAAIGHSGELKMRSLDLLHVSYMVSMKDRGYPIESIVTSDKEFLKAKKFLEKRKIKVVIPEA